MNFHVIHIILLRCFVTCRKFFIFLLRFTILSNDKVFCCYGVKSIMDIDMEKIFSKAFSRPSWRHAVDATFLSSVSTTVFVIPL